LKTGGRSCGPRRRKLAIWPKSLEGVLAVEQWEKVHIISERVRGGKSNTKGTSGAQNEAVGGNEKGDPSYPSLGKNPKA